MAIDVINPYEAKKKRKGKSPSQKKHTESFSLDLNTLSIIETICQSESLDSNQVVSMAVENFAYYLEMLPLRRRETEDRIAKVRLNDAVLVIFKSKDVLAKDCECDVSLEPDQTPKVP